MTYILVFLAVFNLISDFFPFTKYFSSSVDILCLETLATRCELFIRIYYQYQVHCYVNIRRRNKI